MKNKMDELTKIIIAIIILVLVITGIVSFRHAPAQDKRIQQVTGK